MKLLGIRSNASDVMFYTPRQFSLPNVTYFYVFIYLYIFIIIFKLVLIVLYDVASHVVFIWMYFYFKYYPQFVPCKFAAKNGLMYLSLFFAIILVKIFFFLLGHISQHNCYTHIRIMMYVVSLYCYFLFVPVV